MKDPTTNASRHYRRRHFGHRCKAWNVDIAVHTGGHNEDDLKRCGYLLFIALGFQVCRTALQIISVLYRWVKNALEGPTVVTWNSVSIRHLIYLAKAKARKILLNIVMIQIIHSRPEGLLLNLRTGSVIHQLCEPIHALCTSTMVWLSPAQTLSLWETLSFCRSFHQSVLPKLIYVEFGSLVKKNIK